MHPSAKRRFDPTADHAGERGTGLVFIERNNHENNHENYHENHYDRPNPGNPQTAA
jgi:hypothetical protein